jgi:hypothetical protein
MALAAAMAAQALSTASRGAACSGVHSLLATRSSINPTT